ncbi:FeoA-like protein [Nostoc sp. PCC 7524]|jgi:ferrous iron transport protein A|uniref:FeoA family protein n=1 Tax=Nostoc sp. (strain ATCC 29411 / PCC 7524) TaxID=28072 RepID=UPI00029EC880|nr:FeoA family protein [Nostoc sp. PCC 7524]AFY47081.1 FeoA-like protein [Nostoc sp. PCC 7524]
MFAPFSVTGCSLELLKLGEKGIVTFCKTQDKALLKKLTSLGLTTGVTITVEQQFPSLLIKVGSILLEIEQELARAIYVRVLKS